MKFIVPAAAALALLTPAAFAQTATAPAPAAKPAAAKFNLDTPIETLVGDPKAKAVLDADLPGIATHPSYEFFKSMSLRAVQPMSDGKLTDEMLKKVETDLAAIM
ncbi:hypothetical protein FHS95_003075 [Sphingomonas naasensis]|uniref:Uncharacterized protein n=1 Tax=Sphingomonas naasensis TaxID=1344951 RepID=A0A4S1WBF9_9SPHN|nr:hypothetical protein [Sphingomonas naasensis]NIJ21372.1 hypothetical protein [Sphingomonas naasensis]TGX38797.1 hypothetical protein E5A74_18400 [Sphingomonas naasensis]